MADIGVTNPAAGVIATSPGYQEGKEAVKVQYDPVVTSKSQLDKIANQSTCSVVAGGNFRQDATPKYYLSNSAYRGIPMTEIQKCRVNSALAERQDPEIYLSPGQLAFQKKSTQKNYVGFTLQEGWADAKKD